MSQESNENGGRWVPDDAFPPSRNAPCFCGSGERFKRCCGRGAQGISPRDLQVRAGYLDEPDRRRFAELGRRSPGERLKVVDVAASTAERTIRKLDDRRVTERVNLGEAEPELEALVRRAYREAVIPSLGRPLAWFERPQMLRYGPGGFYQRHADSHNYSVEHNAWRKDLDRDVSLLIYLNDDYEGGALTFTALDYVLQPRGGMLVWFPSDQRFQHQAEPVSAGCRLAVVSWAAFEDEPRVCASPPEEAIPWE
ncbi:MAG: 2OG-Fe(II) oxygenase [Xanthomonadales bacterium]|jgi:predicted 2-oxoglutarate/Fe(II)-dependent dioxygenase YbiX|nr:2OG-Fe(II) oxygenase [Xanthomonadales bacterium]